MTLETLHNTSLGEKIKVRNNMQDMIPLKVKTLLNNIFINVPIHVCKFWKDIAKPLIEVSSGSGVSRVRLWLG